MKSRKLCWLFVIVALCVFESGCALQVASGLLDTARASGLNDLSFSSPNELASRISFKTDIDTKESIIAQLGKPKFVCDLKENREVLAYLSTHNSAAVYYFFAIKDGVYQESEKYYYRDVEKDRKDGILESELLRVFNCYHTTSRPTASPPPVSYSPPTFPGEIPK